jgi:hypothetical protein
MEAKEYTTTNVLKLKAEIARLRAEVSDLKAALDVWNSNELGLMIARLRAALEAIAAFGDRRANERLARDGSYASFDEPGSVRTAREALSDEQLPKKQTYVSSTPNPITGLPDTYER